MRNEDGIEIGEITRPDPELLRRLSVCHPASFANPGSLGTEIVLANGEITPLVPTMRVLGPAVTVRLAHIDHITALTAAHIAEPGDILLIAANGQTDVAIWGHGLMLAAQARGVAGVVIDGAVVNKAELIEMGTPVFARGATPVSGAWDASGEVNVPVTIAGHTVHPGDVLLGDADGVVAIPAGKLREALDGVEAKEGEDQRRRDLLAQGVPLLEIVREARRSAS